LLCVVVSDVVGGTVARTVRYRTYLLYGTYGIIQQARRFVVHRRIGVEEEGRKFETFLFLSLSLSFHFWVHEYFLSLQKFVLKYSCNDDQLGLYSSIQFRWLAALISKFFGIRVLL
jgi:hypothetical protein